VGGVHDAAELRVGSGSWPTCVRHATGKVSCWTADLPPTEVPGISGAVEIGVGPKSVFARTASGVVSAHLIDGPPSSWAAATPYAVPHASPVTALRVGQSFCALHQDGVISCSLLDDAGQGDPATPVDTQPPGQVAELAVGGGIAYDTALQCLRLDGAPLAGHVYCWGDDSWGALGAGAPHVVKMPAQLTGLTGMATLTARPTCTVGVSTDGRVWSWGLARGLRTTTSATPSAAAALGTTNTYATTDPADARSYLLETDGSARVLTNALPDPGARLSGIAGFTGYTWVKPNYHWDLALLADGRVVAYGDGDTANLAGIFGNGTTTSMAGETSVVQGLGAARKVSAYGDVYDTTVAHACAVVGTTGALWCWGDNGYSELTGTAADSVPTPQLITLPGGDAVVDVATGREHTCAVGASGAVYCWGYNEVGQLGYDTGVAQDFPLPDAVTGVTNAVSIAAGEGHTCAVLSDHTAVCWGMNDRGQLGDDTFDDRWQVAAVPGLKNVVSMTASSDHTCALLTGGAVSCWGSSYDGQVGSGVTGTFPVPRQVTGL
jgi:alpha-tubulin suppressor-like RCC1 family protein